jgi:hypothetical protein
MPKEDCVQWNDIVMRNSIVLCDFSVCVCVCACVLFYRFIVGHCRTPRLFAAERMVVMNYKL